MHNSLKNKKRISISVFTGYLFLLLVTTNSAFANLPANYGFGASAIGKAGAGMALVNDWSSPYYNIAGLAAPRILPRIKRTRRVTESQENSDNETTDATGKIKIRRKGSVSSEPERKVANRRRKKRSDIKSQLGLGFLYQVPIMNLSIKNATLPVSESNAEKASTKLNYGAINLGIVFDLRNLFSTFRNLPVKFGIALALNSDGYLTRVQDLNGSSYNFLRIGRNSQRLSTILGLAWQVWKDRLSIGFGLNNLAKGSGQTQIRDINLNASGNKPPKAETQIDLKAFSAPHAGIIYRHPLKPGHSLSFGLMFRGELYMQTILDVSAELPLGIITNTKTAIITFYSPNEYIFGLAYAYKSYRIALDLELQQWSGYFISDIRKTFQDPPNFKDIIVPRIGGEFPIPGLMKMPIRGRFGYALIPAFTPDQTKSGNFLDNTKHIMALGVGYIFPKNRFLKLPTRFDFALQYQLWVTRASTKVIDNPYQPDYEYGGHLLMAAISATWIFN